MNKMNKLLTKSPLTYVLAQIKISPILEMENYIPKVHDLIRRDFPLCNPINIQAIEVKPHADPRFTKLTQWHCPDSATTSGILLDSGAIMFHTSDYHSFDQLLKEFSNVLGKINKVLEIGLCLRIGLRYVNLIETNPDKYLQKELLGLQLRKTKNLKNKFANKTEILQETDAGKIKLKTFYYSKESIECTNLKDIIIPPDLSHSTNLLSFDQYNKRSPKGNYAILDLDHFVEFQKSSKFNLKDIETTLKKLHDGVYEVFCKAITPEAKKDWR